MAASAYFHFRIASIGRTTSAPSLLRARVAYALRGEALDVRAFGRHIPLSRDPAMAWATWYEDPHRPDALRANGRLADYLKLALPNRLSIDDREHLIELFMAAATGGRADEIPWLAVPHRGLEDGDDPMERNDHVHMFICDRTVARSRKRSVVGLSDDHNAAYRLRLAWADATNEVLRSLGRTDELVDPRSLLAQRVGAILAGDVVRAVELDRRPQIHVGGAGLGKSKRGEDPPTSRLEYAGIDQGRSRSAANAERVAERDAAHARARRLAESSEAERLAVLAAQAAKAITQILPLRGLALARFGVPDVQAQLIDFLAATRAKLTGLSSAPDAAIRLPRDIRLAVTARRVWTSAVAPRRAASPRVPPHLSGLSTAALRNIRLPPVRPPFIVPHLRPTPPARRHTPHAARTIPRRPSEER